jgi:hypothetical protein
LGGLSKTSQLSSPTTTAFLRGLLSLSPFLKRLEIKGDKTFDLSNFFWPIAMKEGFGQKNAQTP